MLFLSLFCSIMLHAQGSGTCASCGTLSHSAPDGFLVTNSASTNVCDGNAGEAMQLTQDDANGYIGIGICPNLSSVLTVQNFGIPKNSVLEVINPTTYADQSLIAPFSFSVSRVSPPSSGVDLAVLSSGLVGIGTASPSAQLHIYGSGAADILRADAPGFESLPPLLVTRLGNTAVGCTGADATGAPYAQLSVKSQSWSIPSLWVSPHTGGGATDLTAGLIVSSRGQVGIGTATPSYQLDVLGNTHITGIEIVTGILGIGTSSPLAALDIQGGVVRIGNVPISSATAPTLATDYSLYVQKGIIAEKFKCAMSNDATNWSDYVFDKNYRLKNLDEVQDYINKNHHLPDVPSTDDVHCEGIDLAQMDATLLKKIEELTLYVIQQQKEIEALKAKK